MSKTFSSIPCLSSQSSKFYWSPELLQTPIGILSIPKLSSIFAVSFKLFNLIWRCEHSTDNLVLLISLSALISLRILIVLQVSFHHIDIAISRAFKSPMVDIIQSLPQHQQVNIWRTLRHKIIKLCNYGSIVMMSSSSVTISNLCGIARFCENLWCAKTWWKTMIITSFTLIGCYWNASEQIISLLKCFLKDKITWFIVSTKCSNELILLGLMLTFCLEIVCIFLFHFFGVLDRSLDKKLRLHANEQPLNCFCFYTRR